MSHTQTPVDSNVGRFAEKLAVVLLDFRQWSGACVLKEEDFRLGVGGTLPPEQVIHDLGSKCICNPDHLKVFSTIKRRAERLLSNHGVPFMGGMAIPLEKSQEVLSELNVIAGDYNRARDSFIRDYDYQLETWLAQNAEFETQLRQAVLSKAEVERRIYGRFYVFKVAPLASIASDVGSSVEIKNGSTDVSVQTFLQSEESLGDTLLDEIAKEAQALYLRVIAGRQSMMVKNLDHIRKWRERLKGLQFLDNRIGALVDDIDSMLVGMPPAGRLDGEAFYRVSTMVLALSDKRRTQALCQVLNAAPENVSDSYLLPLEVCETNDNVTTQNPVLDPVHAQGSMPTESCVEVKNTATEAALTEMDAELDAFEAFFLQMNGEKESSEGIEPNEDAQPTSNLEVQETVKKETPSIAQCASFGYW